MRSPTRSSKARRIARAEARLASMAPTIADRSPWDWYADGCPCGLPAGECREHPRARASQRPPDGDWRTWLLLMGRGAGKTRSAAEWVRHQVETGQHRWIALVGPTAADVRDYMVGGHSGILAISAALVPAPIRAVQATAHLAQWCHRHHLLRRGARPPEGTAALGRLGRRARRLALPAGPGKPPAGAPGRQRHQALRHHHAQAHQPGHRPDRRPDDGDRPRDDLREPGPPRGLVLRPDHHQVRGDPPGPAGAARRGPRGGRRRLVRPLRPGTAHRRGRPSITPGSASTWPSTAASAATSPPSGSSPRRSARTSTRSPSSASGTARASTPRRPPGRSARTARPCPARAGSTRSGWTPRPTPAPASDRPPTASSSASSAPADHRPLAQAPRRRRPRPARGPARQGAAPDPSPLHQAEGGLPELPPQADRPRRVARRARGPAAPPRGPDRRPPRRRPRPLPRGADRAGRRHPAHRLRLDRLTGRGGRATTKEVLFSGPAAAFTCKQASTDPLAAADRSRPPAAWGGRGPGRHHERTMMVTSTNRR